MASPPPSPANSPSSPLQADWGRELRKETVSRPSALAAVFYQVVEKLAIFLTCHSERSEAFSDINRF
jgi:hypothetical protein